MVEEMVFTSARKGLQVGTSGFCTVASSPGMAANLARVLQSISGYRHLFPPGSSAAAANPVVYSHLRTKVGGREYSILSRVSDAGLDYSNRSNKLAHHIAIAAPTSNPVGPAGLLANESQFFTSWDKDPQRLPPRSLVGTVTQPGPCKTWQAVAGDAGWAGDVIEAVQKKRTVYLIVDENTPAIAMVEELLSLLPLKKQWDLTFSTFFTKLPPQLDCQVRCIIKGSAEVAIARRSQANLVLDLTNSLGSSNSKFADAARVGSLIGVASNSHSIPNSPDVSLSEPSDGRHSGNAKEESGDLKLADDSQPSYSLKSEPPRIAGRAPKAKLKTKPPKIARQSGFWKWGALAVLGLILVGGSLGVYWMGPGNLRPVVKAKPVSLENENVEEAAIDSGAAVAAETNEKVTVDNATKANDEVKDRNAAASNDDEKGHDAASGGPSHGQKNGDGGNTRPAGHVKNSRSKNGSSPKATPSNANHPTDEPTQTPLLVEDVKVANQDLALDKTSEQIVFRIHRSKNLLPKIELRITGNDHGLTINRPTSEYTDNKIRWDVCDTANPESAPVGSFVVRENDNNCALWFERNDKEDIGHNSAFERLSNCQLAINGIQARTRYFSPTPELPETIKISSLKNNAKVRLDFGKPQCKFQFDESFLAPDSQTYMAIKSGVKLNSTDLSFADAKQPYIASDAQKRKRVTLEVLFKTSTRGRLIFQLNENSANETCLSCKVEWNEATDANKEIEVFFRSKTELLSEGEIQYLITENSKLNMNKNILAEKLSRPIYDEYLDLLKEIQKNHDFHKAASNLALQQIVKRLVLPVTLTKDGKQLRFNAVIFACNNSSKLDTTEIFQSISNAKSADKASVKGKQQ